MMVWRLFSFWSGCCVALPVSAGLPATVMRTTQNASASNRAAATKAKCTPTPHTTALTASPQASAARLALEALLSEEERWGLFFHCPPHNVRTGEGRRAKGDRKGDRKGDGKGGRTGVKGQEADKPGSWKFLRPHGKVKGEQQGSCGLPSTCSFPPHAILILAAAAIRPSTNSPQPNPSQPNPIQPGTPNPPVGPRPCTRVRTATCGARCRTTRSSRCRCRWPRWRRACSTASTAAWRQCGEPGGAGGSGRGGGRRVAIHAHGLYGTGDWGVGAVAGAVGRVRLIGASVSRGSRSPHARRVQEGSWEGEAGRNGKTGQSGV